MAPWPEIKLLGDELVYASPCCDHLAELVHRTISEETRVGLAITSPRDSSPYTGFARHRPGQRTERATGATYALRGSICLASVAAWPCFSTIANRSFLEMTRSTRRSSWPGRTMKWVGCARTASYSARVA